MPSTNALNKALTKRRPETFGRYNLLGRIAVGGMAEVYVARCGELLGMQTLIALKRILPVHAVDDKFVQMFQREASIALRLQHRAIARVFEVGKVGEDWFLSMELVQGENLGRVTDALEDRRLHWDPNLIAFIGAEVAQALHYAHSLKDARGRPLKIVHRDVSPENIMLGYDGSVKIIDFGIALCESYASLTTQGAVRGKVQYVSPEQAQTHKLDGRSDVFSLGVVLYECLAGSQPFERTSPMATLDAVVNKPVPPIPHVSPALNDAIIKALEKEPERRYRDADEFAQALLAAISGQNVGPDKVAQLASSLFPKRLARWREIQDMAVHGYGFKEQTRDLATMPAPLEPPDSQQATKVEKYYVVSDDNTEPIATTNQQPPRSPGRRRFLASALGAMTAAAAGALAWDWWKPYHAQRMPNAMPAAVAPAVAQPRINPLPAEAPVITPEPPPPAEPAALATEAEPAAEGARAAKAPAPAVAKRSARRRRQAARARTARRRRRATRRQRR